MDESTRMKWEGRWDQLKGKVRETWGDITDDDIDVAEGNYEQLVGHIKEKTGESQEEIERKLNA
ncbi:MAG TPA: CsbD family protein [Acidimicrobiia bacterium]|nr:CsbD family protein [Acidimicrobiia bacterium]